MSLFASLREVLSSFSSHPGVVVKENMMPFA